MLSSDLKRVALRLLKALDIDEARVVSDHIKHNRWDDLVKTQFNPMLHQDRSVKDFRKICLAQEFLRKADFLDTSIDRKAVARSGFLLSEAQCLNANLRLRPYLHDPVLQTDLEVRFYEILTRARAWVHKTLGPVPEVLNGRFGPGAVFESSVWPHRRSLTQYDKLRNTPHASHNVSEQLISHGVWETAFAHAWADVCPERLFPRTRGNRFTTVPKDATKDRGICIEPGVNVLLQLAVGDHLKTRLKRRGIDLRGTEDRIHPALRALGLDMAKPWKGQALHRKMAEESSVSGSHATIDLSNASDTVCRVLVELLLPDDWFTLLSELRSTHTQFSPTGAKKDERWYRLEKFSSMGNGFTFELETIVFASLAQAIGAHVGVDTFVYGDDIIIPREISADYLAVLRYSGFTPNDRKTHVGASDYFRESCGGDFFLGHDVRPFYIKELPHDPSTWIAIANNLWCWSIKWSMPELMAVRASVLDCIPSSVKRCRGPEELGNLCITDTESTWNFTTRGSVRYIRVWRPVLHMNFLHSTKSLVPSKAWNQVTKAYDDELSWVRTFSEAGVAFAASLLGMPSDGISPRAAVDGFRFGRIAFS